MEPGKNVLFVDDDRDILRYMQMLFEDTDVKITAASNWNACLAALSSVKDPALILLDVMMPGKSGYEMCADLRKMESGSRWKIYYYTAMPESVIREKYAATGADGYIMKDLDIEELKARIYGILGL